MGRETGRREWPPTVLPSLSRHQRERGGFGSSEPMRGGGAAARALPLGHESGVATELSGGLLCDHPPHMGATLAQTQAVVFFVVSPNDGAQAYMRPLATSHNRQRAPKDAHRTSCGIWAKVYGAYAIRWQVEIC